VQQGHHAVPGGLTREGGQVQGGDIISPYYSSQEKFKSSYFILDRMWHVINKYFGRFFSTLMRSLIFFKTIFH
jgi:hypothetical protein